MPRKPKKVVRTEVTEEEIEEQPRTVEPEFVDPVEESLSRVIRRYGEEGLSVRVSMMRPTGWVFLGTFTNPDDADEEALQRRYSDKMPADGGEFKIDVLVNGEPRYQRKVLIAPLAGVQVPVGGGTRTELLLERVLDRMSNPPAQVQQSSALELAQAVAAVRETAPVQPNPIESMSAMMGIMKTMMEFVTMRGGNGEEKPWYREIIDEVKPLAGPIVAGLLKGANGNGATPTQPNPQVQPMTEEQVTPEQLRAILQGLKAYRHMEPGWLLEYIDGHLHDPHIARIVGLVRTQSFEYFASIDPEIGGPAFGEWFRAIYDGLRSDLPEQNPVVADPGGKGGNGGDAPAHAGTGSKGKPARPKV